jgi:hypothetical protein
MRFTSVTFLLAIAVVDANPILDDKNVGNAGVDTEATLRAGQVVGELARRKDWVRTESSLSPRLLHFLTSFRIDLRP